MDKNSQKMEFRLIKSGTLLSINKIRYTDDGKLVSYSEKVMLRSTDVDGLKEIIQQANNAIQKPILEEADLIKKLVENKKNIKSS